VLSDIVQNKFHLIYGPRGLQGATIGEKISTSASMGKIFEILFKKPQSQKSSNLLAR
jgi:hypothetical protein